jgi:hypothetical protein
MMDGDHGMAPLLRERYPRYLAQGLIGRTSASGIVPAIGDPVDFRVGRAAQED